MGSVVSCVGGVNSGPGKSTLTRVKGPPPVATAPSGVRLSHEESTQ